MNKARRGLRLEIKVKNIKGLLVPLEEFTPIMRRELYNSLLRIANKEERMLKSTLKFTDRTGKLRRSLFIVATFKPLGISGGSFNPYAIYVAYPHGTWSGSWWLSYKRRAIPRILNAIKGAANRIVRKWSKRKE